MRTHICPEDHKHGETPTCYRSHSCGCLVCRDANRRRCYEYKKLVAYGRPTGSLISARPVQEHIGELAMVGMRPAAIAAAAGIDKATLARIMRGRYGTKRFRAPMVYAATAEKILAVTPDLSTVPDGHWVDSRGARRRLQALGTRGWAISVLARRTSFDRKRFDFVLISGRVSAETHRAIADLFEELWDKDAPATTFGERVARTYALQRAEAEGWLPALAWDDIDLDDGPSDTDAEPDLVDEIAVELALRGERVHLSDAERAIVIDRAPEFGWSNSEIVPFVGITARHVTRLRSAAKAAA